MKCTSTLLSSNGKPLPLLNCPTLDPFSAILPRTLYTLRNESVGWGSPPPVDEGWRGVAGGPPSLPPPPWLHHLSIKRSPSPPSHSISPNPKRLGGDSKGGGRGEKHHLAPTAHLARRTLSKPFTVISHFHFHSSPFVRYNLKHRRRHSLLTVHSSSEKS